MLQPIHLIFMSAGLISSVSTAYWKVRKIYKDRRDAKELEKALVLQEAKEHSHKNKLAMEAKIELLESHFNSEIQALNQKIINIEETVTKDLAHVKESYNSEIKFLGEKISELKDEVSASLNQIVTLVSKLIEKS